MSLLDAILTESYCDPHDVHIALRTDGRRGRGTIDDPYDGGTRLGLEVRASLTSNRREFVVRTPFPHGLGPGATIAINDAKGRGAGWFNITAAVQEIVSPVHFTLLANHPSDSDLPPAPPDVPFSYKGPIRATIPGFTGPVNIRIYWPVARISTDQPHGLATYGAVRVGGIVSPYAGDQVALGDPTGRSVWFRLPGLPDADDHLDCTVTPIIHRFDEVMRAVPLYSIIRVGPGTFETRGTAPLYIAGPDYLNLHVGFVMRAGLRLLGAGLGATVVKLVMPFDEVGQTIAIGVNAYPPTPSAEVADLTVDCNGPGHVAPYGTFPAPYTCSAVILGGSYSRIRRVRAIHFCTQGVAECFPLGIDQGGVGNPAITFPIIEDCIVEKPGENNTHETTLIAIKGDVVPASARSPITRHNYQNCEYSNGITSELLGIANLTINGSGVATLTTKRPHNRLVGQNVMILNLANEEFPLDLHPLNDTFKITAVTPPTQLQFDTGFGSSAVSAFDFRPAWVGPSFIGRGALSGTGCVNEGNAVYECSMACYQDTGSTRDVVFRDNYHSRILVGLSFNFAPAGAVSDPRMGKSLTRSIAGGKFIATFTIIDDNPPGTSPPLELPVGDAVNVFGARIGGSGAPAAPYSGTFTVVSISPDKRSFSYEMRSDPLADADPPTAEAAITFRSRWQVRRLDYESNICDFYPVDGATVVVFPPLGASFYGYLDGPPFMFPQAVMRNNTFRLIDGAPSLPVVNGARSAAMNLSSSEDTLVEGNLTEIVDPYLIRYQKSRNVTAFDNRTLAGAAVPLVELTADFESRGTLDDSVNDALLLALL